MRKKPERPLSHTATLIQDSRSLMLEEGDREYEITATINDAPTFVEHTLVIKARTAGDAAKKVLSAGLLDTLPFNLVCDSFTVQIVRRRN